MLEKDDRRKRPTAASLMSFHIAVLLVSFTKAPDELDSVCVWGQPRVAKL